MRLTHSFSVELAQQIGLEEAILLNHFGYWHQRNEAAGNNLIDGRYWSYNTIRSLNEQFPYWTAKQLRTIVNHLEHSGLIVTGHHGGQDRTTWYALTDEGMVVLGLTEATYQEVRNHLPKRANANDQTGKSILPNGQLHLTKRANGFDQTGNCILPNGQMEVPKQANANKDTDINTNTNQTVNTHTNTESALPLAAAAAIPPPPEENEHTPVAEKASSTPSSGRPPSSPSKKEKPAKEHFFSASPYYDRQTFIDALTGTDYEIYDLPFYHETVKNWADSGTSAKFRKADWLATARGFMMRDAKEGKARLNATLKPVNGYATNQNQQVNGNGRYQRPTAPAHHSPEQRANRASAILNRIDREVGHSSNKSGPIG